MTHTAGCSVNKDLIARLDFNPFPEYLPGCECGKRRSSGFLVCYIRRFQCKMNFRGCYILCISFPMPGKIYHSENFISFFKNPDRFPCPGNNSRNIPSKNNRGEFFQPRSLTFTQPGFDIDRIYPDGFYPYQYLIV